MVSVPVELPPRAMDRWVAPGGMAGVDQEAWVQVAPVGAGGGEFGGLGQVGPGAGRGAVVQVEVGGQGALVPAAEGVGVPGCGGRRAGAGVLGAGRFAVPVGPGADLQGLRGGAAVRIAGAGPGVGVGAVAAELPAGRGLAAVLPEAVSREGLASRLVVWLATCTDRDVLVVVLPEVSTARAVSTCTPLGTDREFQP